MSRWKCWNKCNFLPSEYQWTFVVDTGACYSLESRALIDNGRKEKYSRAFAFGVRERAQWNYALSYLGGRVLYGESLGDTRAYIHERAACTRAATGRRTGDIASRYVGYARYAGTIFWFWSVRQIRSPFVTEARAFGTRERERENHHRCAFTYGLPCVLLFPPPFVSALSANPLAKKKVYAFVVKVENLQKW